MGRIQETALNLPTRYKILRIAGSLLLQGVALAIAYDLGNSSHPSFDLWLFYRVRVLALVVMPTAVLSASVLWSFSWLQGMAAGLIPVAYYLGSVAANGYERSGDPADVAVLAAYCAAAVGGAVYTFSPRPANVAFDRSDIRDFAQHSAGWYICMLSFAAFFVVMGEPDTCLLLFLGALMLTIGAGVCWARPFQHALLSGLGTLIGLMSGIGHSIGREYPGGTIKVVVWVFHICLSYAVFAFMVAGISLLAKRAWRRRRQVPALSSNGDSKVLPTAATLTTSVTCPFCQCFIKSGTRAITCPACGTPHHEECWRENGGCATYGCNGGAAQ